MSNLKNNCRVWNS